MSSVSNSTIKIAAVPLALVLSLPSLAQEPLHPDEIPGLEAWYRVESLRGKLGEKSAVETWPDASGKGHDLKRETDDRAGVFRENKVNDRSVVGVDVGNFAVESPFELDDHTIFVVARSKYGDQALFRSDSHHARGVLLYQDGTGHAMRRGGVGTSSSSYSDPVRRENDFAIIVLGRNASVLRAWSGGNDISSWARSADILRVASLFNLEMSTFVDRGARGLELAELLFYDRFLSEEERRDVTSYLASRFDLPLAESVELSLLKRLERLTAAKGITLAWYRTADAKDLNDSVGHRVAWHAAERKQSFLEHEAGEKGPRIYCTSDDMRLYLYLALPVRSSDPGVRIRALVLKNGSEYLPDDAETAVFGGLGDAGSAVLELETVLTLAEGDYFEIVTFQDAAEGQVTLGPDPPGLILEAR